MRAASVYDTRRAGAATVLRRLSVCRDSVPPPSRAQSAVLDRVRTAQAGPRNPSRLTHPTVRTPMTIGGVR